MATSEMCPLPLKEENTITKDEKGEKEEVNEQVDTNKNSELINFNIFSYLNNLYRTHGFIDEEFSRFLVYVKKRRKKLKNKILSKTKKVEKHIVKIYPDIIENKEYIELLILDAEYCRCKYVKIKTDVSNLKAPYRSKYNYLNRLKKSIQKIHFLNNIIKSNVDKSTELQIKCFTAYIECAYLLEKKEYKACLHRIDEFLKLIKLTKRTLINAIIENKSIFEKKNMNEEEQNDKNANEMKKISENEHFLDIKEEKKVDEIFEHYLSIVNGYQRVCLYNVKKIGRNESGEKREEEYISWENKNHITEEYTNNINSSLEINTKDTETIIKIKNSKFILSKPNIIIVKIDYILKEINPLVTTEEIEQLYISNDLKNINHNFETIYKFLNKLEVDTILNNYSNMFSKYFDCLSIVHEQLIESTNRNADLSKEEKTLEKIWNMLESHFITEKIYLDIERALLILLKSLCNIYVNEITSAQENKNEGEIKTEELKNKVSAYKFKNKRKFYELIDAFPLLNEGIRYADLLKQNVDNLQNIENNDMLVNMLQIIKNTKALCSAFYYVLAKRNAEAHVLFDQVKTRNYVYLKIPKEQINTPLLRVSILFNRLQDLLYLVNEKYYFRHLAFYSLILKKKDTISSNCLYYSDASLFYSPMNQISMNPIILDMASSYNNVGLVTSTLHKERASGIRGLIKSFWKK